jgi:hypothetical protein
MMLLRRRREEKLRLCGLLDVVGDWGSSAGAPLLDGPADSGGVLGSEHADVGGRALEPPGPSGPGIPPKYATESMWEEDEAGERRGEEKLMLLSERNREIRVGGEALRSGRASSSGMAT